jgi:hypothetical protein
MASIVTLIVVCCGISVNLLTILLLLLLLMDRCTERRGWHGIMTRGGGDGWSRIGMMWLGSVRRLRGHTRRWMAYGMRVAIRMMSHRWRTRRHERRWNRGLSSIILLLTHPRLRSWRRCRRCQSSFLLYTMLLLPRQCVARRHGSRMGCRCRWGLSLGEELTPGYFLLSANRVSVRTVPVTIGLWLWSRCGRLRTRSARGDRE